MIHLRLLLITGVGKMAFDLAPSCLDTLLGFAPSNTAAHYIPWCALYSFFVLFVLGIRLHSHLYCCSCCVLCSCFGTGLDSRYVLSF